MNTEFKKYLPVVLNGDTFSLFYFKHWSFQQVLEILDVSLTLTSAALQLSRRRLRNPLRRLFDILSCPRKKSFRDVFSTFKHKRNETQKKNETSTPVCMMRWRPQVSRPFISIQKKRKKKLFGAFSVIATKKERAELIDHLGAVGAASC